MENQKTRRPGEVIFNAALFGLSLFVFWQAYGISGFSSLSSAGAFPLAMSGIMVVTVAGVLLRSMKLSAPGGRFAAFRHQVLPPVILIFSLFILVYSIVLKSLGFLLASFVFLLVSIWFLERSRFSRALFFSVLSIVGVYIVFRLIFQVVLPEGVIPERAIMAAIGDFLKGDARP